MMNRLTKRNKIIDKNCHYDSNHYYFEIINKLGQLEDIEEELGIDLITLFKALKDGLYYRDEDYGIIKNRCTVGIDTQFIFEEETNLILKIKDYGKTWSLAKKELEK